MLSVGVAQMDRDEILEKLITRASEIRQFKDWADVLANYADKLATLEDRLSATEMDGLLSVGADFYRTLARAEAYRLNAPKPG